jgi:hypothetical protein
MEMAEGAPQEGPLGPLLANIMAVSATSLKLKINEQKSAVGPAHEKLKFLGFTCLAPQTVDRVKTKIREMTSRNKPVSLLLDS